MLQSCLRDDWTTEGLEPDHESLHCVVDASWFLTVESFHPCPTMLPNWFRSFPGYNPALLPHELALWNSSAANLPALGNVPHAQGYDLQPVGNPLHMYHSGMIFDPPRPQPFRSICRCCPINPSPFHLLLPPQPRRNLQKTTSNIWSRSEMNYATP